MISPLFRRPAAQDSSELDALQADVMRFVAVIGLCLAAIFSLLKDVEPAPVKAELEPAGAVPGQSVSPPSPQPPAVRPPPDIPEQRPEPLQPLPADRAPPRQPPAPEPPPPEPSAPQEPPAPPPPPPQEGFSLSFASDQVLYRLLDQERIALFALAGEQYWRYQPGRKGFASVAPPEAYYQMDGATVPASLRRLLASAGAAATQWGVVLPAATIVQLEQLMAANRGGDLLIGVRGEVQIESPGR